MRRLAQVQVVAGAPRQLRERHEQRSLRKQFDRYSTATRQWHSAKSGRAGNYSGNARNQSGTEYRFYASGT